MNTLLTAENMFEIVNNVFTNSEFKIVGCAAQFGLYRAEFNNLQN